ncbi:MAG: LysR family transcriptional regulator [Bdellovibrionota bacterium]
MDYRYIKAFLETAKYLNFSKAAHELNIAQSAVSRQIKLLEEDIGEQLIVRSSKKVLLTQKGKELFQLTQNFDKMAQGIFDKEDRRPLRIGVLHGLLEDWLTPIIASYVKKYQKGVDIHVKVQEDLLDGIEHGHYDLIFSTTFVQSELLSSLKLFEETFVLIAKAPVPRKEMAEYPWIVYSNSDHIFKISKEQSNTVVIVESITAIINLVKAGAGVAIVPDHSLRPGHKLFTAELPELKNPGIYMTSLNYKTWPNKIKEFMEAIKSASLSTPTSL